ncbi:MAG: hypothetical protein P4M00_02455 [Azospirillaceae bacterium]|nr:hypothetical protein [Azospirillaceae bacterium]
MNEHLSIAISPLLPWTILAPLFAVAALLILLALWRRARGALWRALVLAILMVALINPALIQEQRDPVKDVVVIVVDQSPSQAIGERRVRTEQALSELQHKLERFGDLEVRVVGSGGDFGTGPGANDVTETRLFEVLRRAIADVPRRRLAGAVLITDGQVHDVPSDLKEINDLGPIHVLLSGNHDEEDRRLTLVSAPGYGIVGKDVPLTIKVEDMPTPQSHEAMVTVRQDNQPPTTIPVVVGQESTVTVTVDHGGANVIELSVEPAPHELTLANNHVAVVVNGVRDRLRVLLVSGEPHNGERTWRNLLKADPSVDLVHFTILRPPEKQDGTPIRELSLIAFPVRELFEDKLSEFDLIIFDRYRKRGVLPSLYLGNIADYVRKGGALLETGGADLTTPSALYRTPLGAVLPGEPIGETIDEPFWPTVTDLGQRHPVTAGLESAKAGDHPPWGRWFHMVNSTVRHGSVVMTGAEGRPLLILDHVGEGRVAQLMSDQIWLWSRGFEGGGPQAELLRRLAHWLMKEPELEENNLRASVDGTHITIERQSLDPDTTPVAITAPSGQQQQITLTPGTGGVASADFAATEPGIYHIVSGSRSTLAVVGTINPPEFADVRTTADKLAPVTKASGGGMFWLVDPSGVPDVHRTHPGATAAGRTWLGLRTNGDYTVTSVNQVPLLPAAAILALALAALLLAWRREGR